MSDDYLKPLLDQLIKHAEDNRDEIRGMRSDIKESNAALTAHIEADTIAHKDFICKSDISKVAKYIYKCKWVIAVIVALAGIVSAGIDKLVGK